MSDLVAIAYADQASARRAHANLIEQAGKGAIDVEDAVILVWGENGTVFPVLDEIRVATAGIAGAAGGALIGLILLGPLVGMVAGGAVARRVAKRRVYGDVPEHLMRILAERMEPGNAALIVLVRGDAAEDLLPRFREPGSLLHSSLGDDLEAQLTAALDAAGREV